MLPDIDVVGFRYGIPYSHALGHRGFTHSLLFAVVLGAVSVWTLFPAARKSRRMFLHLSALLVLAIASHGLLDAMTDAGLGVGFFIPFDDTRYFASWRPLETSPLSIARFLDGSGIEILLNEMRWVWLPLIFFGAGIALARRRP